MKAEVWKSVLGFEGLYEVSDLGRVRSLPRLVTDKNGKRTRLWKGKILNNICAQTGYHFVSLHRNAERETRQLVHRIVMSAFEPIDNPEEMIVDHRNGKRNDNRLENLRWTTFDTNNRNTPYVRYLQALLNWNNIEYETEEEYASGIN